MADVCIDRHQQHQTVYMHAAVKLEPSRAAGDVWHAEHAGHAGYAGHAVHAELQGQTTNLFKPVCKVDSDQIPVLLICRGREQTCSSQSASWTVIRSLYC